MGMPQILDRGRSDDATRACPYMCIPKNKTTAWRMTIQAVSYALAIVR